MTPEAVGPRLLLVEDDLSLGATLKERLEKESYRVQWAKNLREAVESFDRQRFDLVILDIGLPDGSGFDFANKIRSDSFTPFLFVTAQANAPERLRGFELGAEEFIPKPFHLKEILLRVRHVLENHATPQKIRCGELVIDFDQMAIVDRSGTSDPLQLKDWKLLKYLITVSPRVVSRDEILDSIWGETKFPTSRTVDNAIVRLRQALGENGSELIHSVRGIGYQWLGPKN